MVNGEPCDSCGVRKSLYTPGQRKVAETIRAMRTAAHLTQRQFASRLKRPLNVVSRIESAQRRVDFLEWTSLCKACGVDPVEAGRKLLEGLAVGS
jgi:transcriptional regulator with XRE-family HTH domain